MEEPVLQAPRELVYCRIPLVDGGDNRPASLTLAVSTVCSLLRMRIPTLVCCSGGMSRAPAVAAAALALTEGAEPDQCLQRIVTGHPHDVSLPLWQHISGLLPAMARAGDNSR
jgi:protein-tyrosine phosphatase